MFDFRAHLKNARIRLYDTNGDGVLSRFSSCLINGNVIIISMFPPNRITFPFLREEIEDVAQSVNDLMGRQVNLFVGTESRTLWKTMRT